MKYKKREKNSQKYVSDTSHTAPVYKVKKLNLRRRSVIGASVIIFMFCSTRIGIIKTTVSDKILPKNIKTGINKYIEEHFPVIEKIGKYGADFCFGYLRTPEKNQKSVFAQKEDKVISSDASVTESEVTSSAQSASQPEVSQPLITFNPQTPCEGRISSPFGQRIHPTSGQGSFHNGMDIAAALGTEVCAVESGKVEKSRYDQFSGNLIVIRHTDEYTSSYAHLSKSYVSEGQTVKKGDVIGLVGSTGISTGPHLHIEIRQNGNPVDPASLFVQS